MNRIEIAMTDETGLLMDRTLEDMSAKEIIADIKEIKEKAECSTDAGALRKRVMDALYV